MNIKFLKYSNSKKNISGMTLIELIAVIAIVAILAYLVFAYTSRMRESSHAAVTVSNLRVVAQAALMMANEHNGIIDIHESERGEYSAYATLQRLLYNNGYVRDREVFFSKQFDRKLIEPFLGTGADGGWVWRTMGIVRDTSKNPGSFRPLAPEGGAGVNGSGYALRLYSTENPGDFPLVVDSSHMPHEGRGVDTVHNSWVCWFASGISSYKPVMRDDRFVLMAFADGHAEAADSQRISRIVSRNFTHGSSTVMGYKGQMIEIPHQ